jgi:hypothetical protein
MGRSDYPPREPFASPTLIGGPRTTRGPSDHQAIVEGGKPPPRSFRSIQVNT